MNLEIKEKAIQCTKDLLEKLEVNFTDISAEYEDNDNYLKISIKGEELGMLIGYHGKNLDALKIILSLIINRNNEENSVRIIVNVNDYSEKRTEQLRAMLLNAKYILDSNHRSSYAFPPMNSADRRTIHSLANEMGFKTQSEGEGRMRHVKLVVDSFSDTNEFIQDEIL